jgi:WD40 repeat protein
MPAETQEKKPAQIVRATGSALAVRSAALVSRGLRDLARNANWLTTKVFSGNSAQVAISSRGQVCAVAPHKKGEPQRLVVYDLERESSALALTVPNEATSFSSHLASRAAFAWSPSSQFLVVAWGLWEPALHLFDMHSKILVGTFGDFAAFPRQISWSTLGRYFALAGTGSNGSLELWTAQSSSTVLIGPALRRIGPPDLNAPQSPAAEPPGDSANAPADAETFSSYGCLAFSPNQSLLAAVVEISGEWADDSILLADLPSFRQRTLIPAQGHITDLTWTPSGRDILYCAAGQAFRLAIDAESLDSESLPFGAELISCHPHRPLCVCFSSWLKNSAKGRLFLVDLDTMETLDEHPAENVADLRWSSDASKAYAVTRDGLAFTYEPPF